MKTYCCEINHNADVTLHSVKIIFTSRGGGGGFGDIEPRGKER
jgi:hypothetical protein